MKCSTLTLESSKIPSRYTRQYVTRSFYPLTDKIISKKLLKICLATLLFYIK